MYMHVKTKSHSFYTSTYTILSSIKVLYIFRELKSAEENKKNNQELIKLIIMSRSSVSLLPVRTRTIETSMTKVLDKKGMGI